MAGSPNNLAQLDGTGKLPVLTIPVASIHLPPGLDASKPAAAVANTGCLYVATDTGKTYRSTGSAWVAILSGPLDFGDDLITSLATDGNAYALLFTRAAIITAMQYRADANPGQTLTVTATRSGTSGAGSCSVSIATNGVQTPTGFPLTLQAGDRIITSYTGTSGVTGMAHVFLCDAVSPVL